MTLHAQVFSLPSRFILPTSFLLSPPDSFQGLLRILASLSNLSSRLFNVNFPEKLLEHLQVRLSLSPSLPISFPPPFAPSTKLGFSSP